MKGINLPTKLTEETWFYKDHKEVLEPHLGKFYISYSTQESYNNYFEDFIKKKFAKIELPSSIYAELGNYLGTAVETGEFPKENPNDFQGKENIDLNNIRKEGAEYERLVVIDFEDFIFVGFIDVFHEDEKLGCTVVDLKTGGSKKEETYESDNYKQTDLYAFALEEEGKKIRQTGVYFVRRKGSHVNPPLKIDKEQFFIDRKYTRGKGRKAVNHLKKSVKEISQLYTTYQKIFGDERK